MEQELIWLREKYPDEANFASALARYRAGEPLAYLLGEQYFWRYRFTVTPDVLIPRPDTERLVETALSILPPNGRFADLCTGSGAIALSIAADRPDLTADAPDISEAALTVAEKNARDLNVSDQVRFHRADLLTDDPLEGAYDAILSNPPYIPRKDIAQFPSLTYEPQIALDGGEDGLDFYRAILTRFAHHLKDGGCFLFEIGYDQGEQIRALAASHGYACSVTKDYGGNDRVARLTKLSER
ncbi:MAG: peptide chain release factor N(5)-glutamine methyltransferase [Clostridia bacterium]|nr:peptide chain release factor N(5)-glutamine methyltransferase [Clostridia bacterium]